MSPQNSPESFTADSDNTRILSVRIDQTPLDTAVSDVIHSIETDGKQLTFACANPHSLVEAQTDKIFSGALENTDLIVADGVGISVAARITGKTIGQRIAGADYFFGIMQALEDRGGSRVFFFGSSDKVLGLLKSRINKQFPSIEVCGTLSPPFRPWSEEENLEMIEKINSARPDVVWVGMTAPKQEKWVSANRHLINAKLLGSIGAVFDFVAGTHPRAPQWMCDIGLEWLYRLMREPKRMWKRNFVSTPLFLLLVIKQHILGI